MWKQCRDFKALWSDTISIVNRPVCGISIAPKFTRWYHGSDRMLQVCSDMCVTSAFCASSLATSLAIRGWSQKQREARFLSRLLQDCSRHIHEFCFNLYSCEESERLSQLNSWLTDEYSQLKWTGKFHMDKKKVFLQALTSILSLFIHHRS